MTALQFNVKDDTGTQRFITPAVTVTAKVNGKSKTVQLDSATALQFGYVIRAIAESNGFDDVTKTQAGKYILPGLVNLPADSTVTVHMPTTYADRESGDLGKWTPVVTVGLATLKVTAESLAKIADLREAFDKSVNEVLTPILPKLTHEANNPQPVYFTGTTSGKSKKGSGSKSFTGQIFG